MRSCTELARRISNSSLSIEGGIEELLHQGLTNGMYVVADEKHYYITPYLDRWKYVKDHNVQLPDEYDQIYVDLQPFWGIEPTDLRKIQHELEGRYDTYTLGKAEGEPLHIITDKLPDDPVISESLLTGGYEMIGLLEDVQHLLPPFRAVFSPHDSASIFIDHAAKSLALKAAANGKGKADVVRYILYAQISCLSVVQRWKWRNFPTLAEEVGSLLALQAHRPSPKNYILPRMSNPSFMTIEPRWTHASTPLYCENMASS